MDVSLLPPPAMENCWNCWAHQAENMTLISQYDLDRCDDSGVLEFDLGTTDAYAAASSIEPTSSGVDGQAPVEDVTLESDERRRQPRPPLRLRRPVISSAIWEALKPVIQDLYIRQQLSLDEVQQRMKQEHNFDATDQMYKKRLRDWEVRKNYTQTQKLQVIQKLREAPSETCGDMPVQVNGVPLNDRRLWRPVMQNGNRVVLAPRPSRDSKKNSRKRLPQLTRTPTPQRLQLQLGRETQTIETLLGYAKLYHSWYLVQDQIKVQYGYTVRIHETFDGLREAIGLLYRNDSTAFCLINQSCSHFHALLQAQPFMLLPELVILFSGRQLLSREYWTIWESVLKFFASLANTTLGMLHPITKFMTLLLKTDQEHLPSCLRRYAELLLDQTKTVHDPVDSARIQLAVIDLFEESGQLDIASRLCRHLWEGLHHPDSALTPVHTRVIDTLVRLSRYRGDYSAIERLLMRIFNGCFVTADELNETRFRSFACMQLGWLYFWTGQTAQSEKYIRLALEETLKNEDCYPKSSVLSVLSQVELILWKFGKSDELAQLQAEYQHVRAKLDDWRLDRDVRGPPSSLPGLG